MQTLKTLRLAAAGQDGEGDFGHIYRFFNLINVSLREVSNKTLRNLRIVWEA